MNLNARRCEGITLLTAINECGDLLLSAIALLYTPDWCGFAQVEQIDGSAKLNVSPANAERFDQETIFEARVFNARAELRWLRQSLGEGCAALISEEDLSQYLASHVATARDVEIFDQPYLLWGEGTAHVDSLPANWSRLAMARIGPLDVPYPLTNNLSVVNQTGERIYLITREYLAVADSDDHGNVSVVDERLLKLVGDGELRRMGQAGEVKLEEYA